ncbi:hypothetical protein [Aminipila terrae]|uniref:Uncharacterized protein n=1 Tax=Aminipila terrae TaxID=2697030 RepID=A0A6P1MCW4_9FIRM|nr:hypothetical protein [Aminipila terrae]QHI72490.1 hypothetical protein Ami3637_08865 [Aminipila terrae]
MTFNLRKSLAVLMIIAMVMSTGLSAYGMDWPTYQGNDIHNGILTDGAEISGSPSVTRVDLPKNGSGSIGSTWAERQPFAGVDTVPVMETRNGNTYAYVLYDGYKAAYGKGGGRLAKIDCTASTPQVVWDKQITQCSGIQLSSPYLDTDNRCIYVGASGYNQKAYNDGLALTGGAITDGWTVSSAGTAMEDGKVTVSGNQTVTLTQTNVNLTKGDTHRSATCVKINGNNVNMTITAKLNGTIVGSESLNSCNFIDGRFYFNLMFGQQFSTAESAVNTGTNNILEFTYEISENDSNTVEIEYCQLYEQNSSITKVANIDEEPITEWSLNIPDNAVIGTPIVKSGEYLYFGTWSGHYLGTYYQYDLDNEELKTFNPGNGGFYRAGAVVEGNYVYFGGDKGYLYARPVGNDFDNTSEGSVINLSTVGGVESGNVRSTISLVDGHLYFTSQGGYLWSFTPEEGIPTLDWKAQLAGTSTSTPTVVGDNIYVGYYSGFTAGGVQKVAKTGNHEVSSVAEPGPVLSSILVYTKGGVDYLYFTTNSRTGAGYCFNGSNGAKVWQTPGETYALQGMAYSGGVLTFGNDNDSFYVIGERYVPPTPPETSIPNNTGELLWPADSSEVTLWFGQIDEQYTAVNKGMNIQGTANSNVYSVCDGVVAYKGYSSTYGNLLYVDFKYNNITMQVRYGHLSESSSWGCS